MTVILEIGNWIEHILAILGFFVLAADLKFVKEGPKGIVDQTFGWLAFLFVIWTCGSRKKEVAKVMPFVGQELTEWLKFSKDDGVVK